MLNWRDPRNPLAGGAERVTLGYLAYLASRGHEVYWFSPVFPEALPEEIIDGVRIVRRGRVGVRSLAKAIGWYRTQPRFDLVIDQHHGIPWYAPWWCRTHCVAYIHEVLGPIWDTFYPWPYNKIGKFQERWTHWAYRNIPFWTASSATKTGLIASGVRSVTTIPYGVHTVALPVLDEKPLELPLKLTAVSRLAPNKRVHHIIQACHCLKEKGISTSLTVVGSGVVEQELKTLATSLGLQKEVQFMGALDEAAKDAVMRNAHLLLHTSVREGWGLNVIEANAMGTPAVVYPVAGLVESTLHRQTGLVSEFETPESLAKSILEVFSDKSGYQKMRLNAWERAKTFHWSQVLPVAADWLESKGRGE